MTNFIGAFSNLPLNVSLIKVICRKYHHIKAKELKSVSINLTEQWKFCRGEEVQELRIISRMDALLQILSLYEPRLCMQLFECEEHGTIIKISI